MNPIRLSDFVRGRRRRLLNQKFGHIAGALRKLPDSTVPTAIPLNCWRIAPPGEAHTNSAQDALHFDSGSRSLRSSFFPAASIGRTPACIARRLQSIIRAADDVDRSTRRATCERVRARKSRLKQLPLKTRKVRLRRPQDPRAQPLAFNAAPSNLDQSVPAGATNWMNAGNVDGLHPDRTGNSTRQARTVRAVLQYQSRSRCALRRADGNLSAARHSSAGAQSFPATAAGASA